MSKATGSNADISPLTTTFTAPASCASEFTVLSSQHGHQVTLVPFESDSNNPLNYQNFQQVATCYPPTFLYLPNYSPAFVCPSGYTTAFRYGSYLTTVTTLPETFTYAECCPSDYPFVPHSKKCIRSFTSTEVFSVSGTETHFTTLGEGVAFAPSIQLYWKQMDLDEHHTTMAVPTHTHGPERSGRSSQSHSSPSPTSSPAKIVSTETLTSTLAPAATSSKSGGTSLGSSRGARSMAIGIAVFLAVLRSK